MHFLVLWEFEQMVAPNVLYHLQPLSLCIMYENLQSSKYFNSYFCGFAFASFQRCE